MVRFVPEDGKGQGKDFDFAVLPLAQPLREAFALGFAARTRPAAGLRSIHSAENLWRRLAGFAHYLAGLARPPRHAGELTEAQLRGWLWGFSSPAAASYALSEMKVSLRRVPGISPELAAALTQSHKHAKAQTRASTYSHDEFRRILAAARFDARRAARRIRDAQALVALWRRGAIDPDQDRERWQRGRLLDYVERHTDVPRYTVGRRPPMAWAQKLGSVTEHITSLHLSADDAAAFAVLLVGLTGQNPSTIVRAPAAHHRPDGHTGPVSSAIVELDKPRRGSRRHMDLALVGLPDWVAAPSNRPDGPDGRQSPHRDEGGGEDLHSPFGVYMLLHDLTAPARALSGTDRLFVWWSVTGGRGTGTGFRAALHSDLIKEWAQARDLPIDRSTRPPADGTDGEARGGAEAHRAAEQAADHIVDHDAAPQLRVTLSRLRRTYLALHHQPVAHTEATLVNDYLARQRGNLTEYQRLVADTLDTEARKARTRTAMRTLSPAEVAHARTDPAAVAARHGMDPATLRRLLAGELDTVMNACADNTGGPHTPPGEACRASFMLCLSCPCARALPHHLPVQVAVHDALAARQTQTTPLRWARRFALPRTQLADLLERAGPRAVTDARDAITADQRELVERFLRRELDRA